MTNTIDYDLKACLEYNPQDGYAVDDIAEVLAVWQGENDGDNWRWILRLNDNRFVYLNGWCDFTGWDCQSGAYSRFAESPDLAAKNEEDLGVQSNLIHQLSTSKSVTWREKKDAEFGVDSNETRTLMDLLREGYQFAFQYHWDLNPDTTFPRDCYLIAPDGTEERLHENHEHVGYFQHFVHKVGNEDIATRYKYPDAGENMTRKIYFWWKLDWSKS